MTIHPVAAAMLSVARSMLGEMENPRLSNSHPTVAWYNKTIQYLAPTWNYCAGGVTREFELSPAKGLYRPRAYVPWSGDDFLKAYAGGQLFWIDNATDLNRYARAGDVVYFDWDATKKHSTWVMDHIGVVERDASGGRVVTIEHNTSVAGTNNEGVARRVRDAKYVAAIGRPNWDKIEMPKIHGTGYPLLTIDGSAGPSTLLALSKIMSVMYPQYAIPVKGTLDPNRREPLVVALQWSLNKAGHRCRHGKPLVLDGMGFGSNTGGRYPRVGSTHTIEAMQIAHGVKRANADGYFDAYDSSEVRRIQRDVNVGGILDNPFMN